MLKDKDVLKEKALDTHYFTKEFPGFEIESKWLLLTENPVPTILQFISDIHSGIWTCLHVAKAMGKLPVGLRFFELQFDFWAIPDTTSQNGYQQVAMVAKIPSMNKYQVAFKGSANNFYLMGKEVINPPLVRVENRKGDWIEEKEVIHRIKTCNFAAEKVASIIRQKCYVYVQNIHSYRNFSLSADLCYYRSKVLSQVEIEYKGRSGLWFPDTIGKEILCDFKEIHSVLIECYGDILLPTTETKFDWIMRES